ncbi:MAG: glycosyltransferase family 9 protein [Cytophagales bacterium]|nr:glycosyltransferase family 9 protein [Armatimonadota bacterium]
MPKLRFPEFLAPLTPCNVPVQRSTAPSMQAASRRILIVRTGANGDILMGTPLLTALRHAWPDAHITWMVEYRNSEVLDTNPHLDELLLWDTAYWKRMTRAGLYPLWFLRWRRMRYLLREKSYDLLISLQPEDWSFLARDIGSSVRIGVFDTFREYHGQKRTSRWSRRYTRAFSYEEHPEHRVDQYLLPLEELGLPVPSDKRMTLGYTEEDEQIARQFIERELNDSPFVVIAPVAGWPSRHWPTERYAAVADGITKALGHRIVLVAGGGEKDRSVVREVADQMHTHPVLAAGTFGFRGLAALIARAAITVSGDTGPMHVAAAVGVPYVALFGPTPPARFAPRGGGGLAMLHPVECSPCHRRVCPLTGNAYQQCLRGLTQEAVLAAVLQQLHPGDAAMSSSVARETSRDPAGL